MSFSICSHHHNSSAKEGEGKENPSLNSANGASNSGEIPRRYCPCCYCELFGHNAVSATRDKAANTCIL